MKNSTWWRQVREEHLESGSKLHQLGEGRIPMKQRSLTQRCCGCHPKAIYVLGQPWWRSAQRGSHLWCPFRIQLRLGRGLRHPGRGVLGFPHFTEIDEHNTWLFGREDLWVLLQECNSLESFHNMAGVWSNQLMGVNARNVKRAEDGRI